MKRQILFTTVAMCMFMSVSKADLTKFPLCTASNSQDNPVMDGQVAVWADARDGTTNYNIYAYSFSEPNELVICTAGGHQKVPAVSGHCIVWQDERGGAGKKDIYRYDLKGRQEYPVCVDGANQEYPDVSGDIIVWRDLRNGNGDIFGYDLSRGQEIEICTHPAQQYHPAIDYPWVVWVDARSGNFDIYAKNLETQIEYPVCTDAANQFYPDVSGGVAVWQDDRNAATDTDIYARPLPAGAEQEICLASGPQSAPAIDYPLIAWQDERSGVDSDIYTYDLVTLATTLINSETGDQDQAAVCGSRILWRSAANVYYADMPIPTILTVLTPNGGEMVLAQTSTEITWHTQGPAPEYIKIIYSDDSGQTWDFVNAAVPNTGTYLWNPLPDLDSQQCLVKISDTTDPLTVDVSDAAFTIFQCDPLLTADLSGDCYVDLEDFAIWTAQWLACGNLYDPQWCTAR